MTASPNSEVPGISCIIPVFNEANAVAATLRGVAEALGGSGREWEIVLVDDGSRDGTLEAARASGVEFASVAHDRNRGYGAAIKSGVRRARYSWILIIDADGTYPTTEITK